jgi:phenylpyruvate tautomerase PptA (4-oxalocrotonate tautomerase family)
MPLLNLFSSAQQPDEPALSQMLKSFSSLLARELGKPERYVMVGLAPRLAMSFAGGREPACYAELKNVGHLEPDKVEHLSEVLCDAIAKALGLARDRIYIEFTNADGALWGFDGGTFG